MIKSKTNLIQKSIEKLPICYFFKNENLDNIYKYCMQKKIIQPSPTLGNGNIYLEKNFETKLKNDLSHN